jgi:hypothetical protein
MSLGASPSHLAGLNSSAGGPSSDRAAYWLLAKAAEDRLVNRAQAVVLQQKIAAQQSKQAAQDVYIKYLQSQLIASTAGSAAASNHSLLGNPVFPPHLAGALSLAQADPSQALVGSTAFAARYPAVAAAGGGPINSGFVAAALRGGGGRPSAASRAELSALERKLKVAQTLKALGTSLRSRYDPFIDCLDIEDPDEDATSSSRRSRGGVSEHFPERLHRMLLDVEEKELGGVTCFLPHGRAFAVLDEAKFVNEIMPMYFKQSKWNSFARQLNLYGFVRMASGPDAGAYYHELFLKSRPSLCKYMRRVGVPQGQQDRRKCRPKNVVDIQEPDFYAMRPSVLSEEDRAVAVGTAAAAFPEADRSST